MSAQGRRWYRPGGWFGIFGERATVLLPPSEKHRVAALWALVDDGAGFDEVLDGVLSGGLRDLPAFVLVSPVEDGTKVVLRGPAVAGFLAEGRWLEVAGSRDTTWVERTLTGVTRMVVEVETGPEGDGLVVDAGLVRLSRVEQPPPEPDPEPTPPAYAEVEVVEPETVVEPPIWHEPELEQPEPEGPVARLRFSSGEEVAVDRLVLVGRAPEPQRYTLTEEPVLVRVPSPHQEISATHLEVRPGSGAEGGRAVVTDLGSTNGTVLYQPGAQPEDLHPGIAVPLAPGALIDLGDGLTIQVE